MPIKLIRCIKKVSKTKAKKYAWPICIKSTGLHPYKHKRRSK